MSLDTRLGTNEHLALLPGQVRSQVLGLFPAGRTERGIPLSGPGPSPRAPHLPTAGRGVPPPWRGQVLEKVGRALVSLFISASGEECARALSACTVLGRAVARLAYLGPRSGPEV